MRKLLTGLALLLLATVAAWAQPTERWLHVRVEKTGDKAEFVRVNIPLTLAEKVLPAIHAGDIQEGKLRIGDARVNGVDIRAMLEAVRTLGDGEFVTVETGDETVRVAKEKGFLIARVHERTGSQDRVDVKVPMAVVDALLSGEGNELNLAAAVRALSEHGDDVFVTVTSKDETVRIWVDARNTTE